MPRELVGPRVGAAASAGVLGAGLVDLLVTIARTDGASAPGSLALLALALYGVAALACGLLLTVLASGFAGVIPGGPRALPEDVERDQTVATALLTGVLAALVLAAIAALGEAALIRKMQSEKLATIAAGGMVLIGAPVAIGLALAARGALRALVRIAPRSRRLGRTGVCAGLLGLGAVAGVVFALSRADWRVLDLGWLVSLGIAAVLGAAHAAFWFGTDLGRRRLARVKAEWIWGALAAVVLLALGPAWRIAETSPALTAVSDGSLGLRLGLGVARRVADRDGDGFAAAFGGGDCDDRRADVYPGAEDAPGDGVDQNCEGGDARPAPVAAATAPTPAPAVPAAARADAFKGNILIVTIDALRADRLGVAGYGRPPGRSLTPTLDALARRGAYFRRAWSQAPNTPRSFPSILTSRFPSDIAWDKPGVNYPNLLPSNRTFFEDLAAHGLKPIGIFSHFYFTADRGISKAFAEWSNVGAGTIAESNKDIASPRIIPRVIERLRKAAAAKERFVLWTHVFEPHSTYMTHPEFPVHLSGVPGLMEKYDYEIAYTDTWIKKLLDAVEELGLAKDTAVVVMADHGEAFGEHKVYFHGQDLFEEQLRVPLIVALPGASPRVVEDPVALVDVGPTLVDLVGGTPAASFRGRSLLPLVRGEKLPARPIHAELLPATAWPHHAVMSIEDGKKIIHRVSDRRFELYDLETDPAEKRNLANGSARPLFDALRAKIVAFEERAR